jgi:Spx/MgsR family transcriptional regulator
LLAEHDVEFDRLDYFREPFTVDELRGLLDEIGVKPSEILSTRSKAYRDLGLADRDVSEEELLALMPDNPTLLRRPIVVKDGQSVIGFNQEKIEALIS